MNVRLNSPSSALAEGMESNFERPKDLQLAPACTAWYCFKAVAEEFEFSIPVRWNPLTGCVSVGSFSSPRFRKSTIQIKTSKLVQFAYRKKIQSRLGFKSPSPARLADV